MRLRTSVVIALSCAWGLACGGGEDTTGSGGDPDTGAEGSGDSGSGDDGDTTGVVDDDPDDDPDDAPDDSGGTTNTPAECGNGIVEGLEQCDDNNSVNGDGCDNDCTENFDTSIWQVTQGGDASVREAGQGVAVDRSNDDIVVVGYIVHAVGNPDIFIRKYDTAGEEIWTVEQDLSMGIEDRAYGVAIDGSGNIAVVGDTDVGPASSDIWLALLDAAGNELWAVTVDGPDAGNDGGRGVAFDSAGNVGATGLVRAGSNDNDIWVAMYEGGGAELWSQVISGPKTLDDRGRGVVFDQNDDLYVAGYISNGGFNRDVWVRKYDGNGAELWTETWDSDLSADDAGFAIALWPSGWVAVAGISPVVANNQDFWLGNFGEDGALQWWKRFGAPAVINDNANGVAVDSGNNTVVVGFKGVTETDTDIWMRRYDPTGLELWTQSVFGAGMDNDEARAVAIDSRDNIIVTGEIRDNVSNDGDIWVGKFGPG